MLQALVRFCSKSFLLILLLLCVSHPVSSLLQASTEAGRAEQPAAISDVGRQAMVHDAPSVKSKQSSLVSTEIEPLLLLLFGLILFSVATGVMLKLKPLKR